LLSVYYSPAYTSAAYAFPTTRKSGWIAESLAGDPIPGLQLVAPDPLTEADLLSLHDAAYVQAVRTGEPRDLAESQKFVWDPGLWPMVLASNGGAVAAARRALSEGVAGSLSSGLHHARRGRGNGYCTFNGLVLAARAAQAAGARQVLIVDVDAHCGGGTAELIAGDPDLWQLDLSVDTFDRYEPGSRVTLDLVTQAADYLPVLARRLGEHDSRPFDLCLYNAGMDPHEDCPDGALAGIDEARLQARDELVFDWCRARRLPVAFVMAGGYVLPPRMDEARLVALHRLTLAAAARFV
jgi:acetoin utilization deacetylase AcuC-like enzyme